MVKLPIGRTGHVGLTHEPETPDTGVGDPLPTGYSSPGGRLDSAGNVRADVARGQ